MRLAVSARSICFDSRSGGEAVGKECGAKAARPIECQAPAVLQR
jgi:hypothetical protein